MLRAARASAAPSRNSPLLPPLTGPVFLAELPGAAAARRCAWISSGVVKLSLGGDRRTGKPLRTAFAGLPDVPLERFELTFDANRGLPRATGLLPRPGCRRSPLS